MGRPPSDRGRKSIDRGACITPVKMGRCGAAPGWITVPWALGAADELESSVTGRDYTEYKELWLYF